MNWEAVATIAEVIGAVAVVASVIYLAIQVRENTRLSAEEAVASAINAFTDYDRLVVSTPDLASLIIRGENAPSSLTPDERLRFDHLISLEFGIYEVWHEKSERISIGQHHEALMRSMMSDRLTNASILEWWRENRDEYTPSFTKWVESVRDRS